MPDPDDRPRTTVGSLRPPSLETTEIAPAAAESAASSRVPVTTAGGWLPSRPAEVTTSDPPPATDPLSLGPGDRIGDFLVERLLGRGGFGAVYLARQRSLDRLVALKVVAPQGEGMPDGEGRSLARLEHDHIVAVYAETVDPATGVRLLCMQYVAGTTLAEVLSELRKDRKGTWTGADFISVLDRLGLPPALFDPAAIADREFLLDADHVEAVCRIGEQLARALAHAHARGVLHHDVKPANVLVSRYGRPLLADFNLASGGGGSDEVVGGTLAYMAPEQIEAFDPASPTTAADVEERSDLFSLAVVLWELSAGGRPFPPPPSGVRREEMSGVLTALAESRRGPPGNPPLDRRLRAILAKGLAPTPVGRYDSAGEFAAVLAGLREQRAAVRGLPAPSRTARWAWRHPVAAMMAAGLVPQFLGSALQISYNAIRIMGALTDAQRAFFPVVVVVYNLLAYPACVTWIAMRVWRVVTVWNALRRGDRLDPLEVVQARRRALALPRDAAAVACVGWLPGAVLFPIGLHLGGGPLPAAEWAHFLVSFALAGLIAVTYAFGLGLAVVLRSMYVRFWADPRDFRDRSAVELADVPDRLRTVNILAGLIPLAGAIILVLVGPRVLPDGTFDRGEYAAFRFLAAALILAGVAGFFTFARLTRDLLCTVDACTGRAAAKSARRTKLAP